MLVTALRRYFEYRWPEDDSPADMLDSARDPWPQASGERVGKALVFVQNNE